jgi:hypothetical protein
MNWVANTIGRARTAVLAGRAPNFNDIATASGLLPHC